MVMVHVVYCDPKENELEHIVSKRKTTVIRGAAGRKIPHSRVFEGEMLYFMEKGTKKITAKATVSDVKNYVKLTDESIIDVLDQHQDKLHLSSKQKQRWHKRCLVLVDFTDMTPIEPLAFDHQKNMDDWLIIENIEDVLVGTSIPYDYSKSKFK